VSDQAKCGLCGEPMPEGETMFKYHGYSGSCPKPPLPKTDNPSSPMTAEERAKDIESSIRILCEKYPPEYDYSEKDEGFTNGNFPTNVSEYILIAVKKAIGEGYQRGAAEMREKAAELFPIHPYPDCPVQMTYQEAAEKIRALEIKNDQ
jgi:hypothetical protein